MSETNYHAAITEPWTSSYSHPYRITLFIYQQLLEDVVLYLNTMPQFRDHTGQNLVEAIPKGNLVGIITDNGGHFNGKEL